MKQIIVYPHAERRMYERMGTRKDKLLKIARKAWQSKEKNPRIIRSQHVNYLLSRTPKEEGGEYAFRSFAGFVFIFIEFEKVIKLITVLTSKRVINMTERSVGATMKSLI